MNWLQYQNNNTENSCYGVDMSKNFDVNWREDENTADDKCSDFYEGPSASSEPEVKLLSKFLKKHNKNIKLFVNLDGFGQQVLFPSEDLKQSRIDDLNSMARSGLRNIKMHRSSEKKYEINSNDNSISLGSPESFAMHEAKIKYSFRIEAMDNRQHSIFVPSTSIEKNANEIFDIIKGMVKHLENE